MNSLTHFHYSPSSPALREGILFPLKGLSAVLAAFRQWRERVRLINELSGLEDRELADINLQRSDITMLAQGHPVPAVDRWLVRR